MEQFKTVVNPVVLEFTMDCKDIYGFDLSLVKRVTACCFSFVGEYR